MATIDKINGTSPNAIDSVNGVEDSDIDKINGIDFSSVALSSITPYFNNDSLQLCDDAEWRSNTVYSPSGHNIATCYANSETIYADSTGNTVASNSHYKDTYSKPYTWYKFLSGAWSTTGTCS